MTALLASIAAPAWKLVKLTIPVPLMLILAALAWAHLDKASAVRRAVDAAVEDLVNGAEKHALAAQLAEERRLRQAGEVAIAGYQRALAEFEARRAVEDEKREQEIADYETKLAAAGRDCLLDRDDLDWLRKP